MNNNSFYQEQEEEEEEEEQYQEQCENWNKNMPLRLSDELVESYASRCIESGIKKFNSASTNLHPSISQGRHYMDVNNVLNNLGKYGVFLESGVYIWYLYHSLSDEYFAFWENYAGFFGWFKMSKKDVLMMFGQRHI